MDGTPRPSSELLALIGDLEEDLAIHSLENLAVEETFGRFCDKARAGGLSLARVLVTWRLLNPLFFSETLLWRPDRGVETERFRHWTEAGSPAFLRSPLWHVLTHKIQTYRCNLAETDAPRAFEVLDEFAADGLTDYLTLLVGFGAVEDTTAVGAGVLVSVCSDRPGGFLEGEIEALQRLKYMLAVSIRTSFQAEIVETLARTYLGRTAGRKVLSGQITRGGGECIEAIIWYCDLRNSTGLCERMGIERYIPFLNDYFTATAGCVAEAGGEILDFIGDAVLAVFPIDDCGIDQALAATGRALENLRRFQVENCELLGGCASLADLAGIAIDRGRVVYGNIGIADRLTFSVIGPTVNRVARIERLTKALHEPVLATRAIAETSPGGWRSRGSFHLDGVAEPQEIFSLAVDEPQALALAASRADRG